MYSPKRNIYFPLEGAKREESGRGNVCQGFGEETQSDEGGGGAGEHGGGLPVLWETYGYGYGI